MPVFKSPYSTGRKFNGSNITNLKNGNVYTDDVEENNPTKNQFPKKSSDIVVERKTTSVVKSSKVRGVTDNEETAHFVFFDMED